MGTSVVGCCLAGLLVGGEAWLTSGFSILSSSASTKGHRPASRIHIHPSSSMLESDGSRPELWLDLRMTALFPDQVVDYLIEQLIEDNDGEELVSPDAAGYSECPFDRILLSDESFQLTLNKKSEYTDGLVDILYIPTEAKDQVAISDCTSNGGMSVPFGSIAYMGKEDPATTVDDPIISLDVLSSGKWMVLLDEDDGVDAADEPKRVDSISSFLQLAVASSGGFSLFGGGDSDGGLILEDNTDTQKDKLNQGGVAVGCSSKSMLVQMASLLQTIQSGSSVSTTESGILIQSSENKSDCDTETEPALRFALVLPFDLTLWKTALLLYGRQRDEIEGDES